jgi:hypothetical protein
MKHLLSILFCFVFSIVGINPASSTENKKPKKPRQTVLVKAQKMPAVRPASLAAPAIASSVLSDTGKSASTALPPTPWSVTKTEAPPILTAAIVSPTIPAATPPPTNPYLPSADYPKPNPPIPKSDTNPFEGLKSIMLFILPDGIGQTHPPLYVKYIGSQTDSQSGQKPILLFQVSCPTKALFGFDTPPIHMAQLAVDEIIGMINATDILPIELQKVCS